MSTASGGKDPVEGVSWSGETRRGKVGEVGAKRKREKSAIGKTKSRTKPRRRNSDRDSVEWPFLMEFAVSFAQNILDRRSLTRVMKLERSV